MPRSARPEKFGKKYRIRWLDEHGKRQFALFTTYTDADRALRKKQAETDQVKHGLRDPDLEVHTFDELAAYWVEHRLPRKRSQKDDTSILKVHLKPFFGAMRLQDITLSRVDEFVKAKAGINVKTLHNVLTLFITLLNTAIDIGWLRSRPRIKKPKIVQEEYTYLRTDKEIQEFLKASQKAGPGVFELYCTAVYTGMRAGELMGLKWDDVDFEQRLITVQRSYDRPTKTGNIRHVPILDPLLPVLRAWRLRNPNRWVFPNTIGNMNTPSAKVTQEIFHKVLQGAGLEKLDKEGHVIGPKLTFHDLRHTFASHWMMRGGDLFRLQRILGHATPQMTDRYSHLSPEAFSSDYGRMKDVVPRGEDGRVIFMNRGMNRKAR